MPPYSDRTPIGWLCTAGLLVLLVASSARADARTDARAHFDLGMRLIATSETLRGIGELKRAYSILPHPDVLYNIGLAYAQIQDYDDAIEYFEAYVASDPPDRDAVVVVIAGLEAQRTAAEEAEIRQLRAQASAQPTGTTVTVGPAVEEEDLESLEEGALQIATLAEVSESGELREHAERLRALASQLEAGTGVQVAAAGSEGEPPPVGPTEPQPAPALALQAQREEGIYEEQAISASRAVENPVHAPSSLSIVTAQDIRMSGLPTIPEILRQVAGVHVFCHQAQSCGGGLSIRGLNARLNPRILVLIDGRSVYQDFLGSTFWNTLPINLEDIDRIEVVRGPASALYGADAFSGIVNIITRDPGESQSLVQARVGTHGTVDAHGTAAGRIDRFSYRFSAGHQRANPYEATVAPDRDDLRVSTPFEGLRRTWGRGDLRYHLGQGYYVRAGTGVTAGDWSLLGTGNIRELQLRDVLFAQTYASLTTPGGFAVRAFWNRVSLDTVETSDAEGDLNLDSELDRSDVVDIEAEWLTEFAALVDHELLLGVGYRGKRVKGFTILDANHTEHHFSAFLQDSLVFTDWLRLVGSARVDRHPLLDAPVFSPRGALIVNPTDGSAARFQVGTAFRTPTFVESYLDVDLTLGARAINVRSVGSTNLRPERITSLELGYVGKDFDFLSIEANGYLNFIEDIISLTDPPDIVLRDVIGGGRGFSDGSMSFEAVGISFLNTPATYRQLGGEVGVRLYPVEGLDVYVNYAITDLTLTSGSSDPQDSTFVDDRDSTHMVNAGVQYRSSIGADFAVNYHWQSEQFWVEQGTIGGYVERTLPAYSLLSARVAQRLLDDRLELSVTGTNLLFQDFRQHPFGARTDTRIIGDMTLRF